MKQLIFIILLMSVICYSAEIKIVSDAFEVNGEEWYASESGMQASISYYITGPLKLKSIYSISTAEIQKCDSAYVRGYEWKDKKDKFKYKKIKKEDLEKHKHINYKDKKKDKEDK